MSEVTKEIFKKNEDFSPFKPLDYDKFLVISLGTGSAKIEERFSAQEASKWGVLGWLYNDGTTPLIDIFTQASADMVDIHASVVFQALHSGGNYLRIQVSFTVSSRFLSSPLFVARVTIMLIVVKYRTTA